MMNDEELFGVYLQALHVSQFKDFHEGLVVLKTFIAILIDFVKCEDWASINAFWVAGTKAIDMILAKEGEDNE